MTLDHLCRVRACCKPQHLKPETRRQNKINGTLTANSTSRYVGVCWFKRASNWRANMLYGGKHRFLGHHVNESDAALTYDAACTLLGIAPQNTAAGETDTGHIAEATRHLVRQGALAAPCARPASGIGTEIAWHQLALFGSPATYIQQVPA